METLPTNETFVLSLQGGINIYITQEEAEAIQGLIKEKRDFIKVRERVIMSRAILYIVPAKDIEEGLMIKRGCWKCPQGHWMPREAKKCEEAFSINGSCYY